ncbi:MAG: hypothetical protein ACHQU0_01585 [Candidatus Paceibacteria bacterium]
MDYIPTHSESSHKMWYIIGGTILVVGAVLVARYYYAQSPQPASSATTAVATQPAQPQVDTSVASINADFNQTSDYSAELTADKASSSGAVSAF